jgi:formylglycine-generating enzyme required for sulfatase activity
MTKLIGVTGGIFEMGTTQKEITQAVDDCLSRDKGKCDASMSEDSFPAHNVTVNAFRMEEFEISNDQYVAFLNYLGPKSHLTGCGGEPCVAINDAQHLGSYIKFDGTKYTVSNPLFSKRPVTYVTWYGADSFCKTLGRRLPTEAEWERAARDPDKRIYPWGNDWDPANPKARTSSPKNEGGPDVVDAFPAGKSTDGIYNLAGNVSEWVNDWYESGYYKTLAPNAIDPQGPEASSVGHKVVRGGDWDAKPFFARTVHRRDYDPLYADSGTIGFRCVTGQDQSAPPTKAPVAPGGAAPQATLPAQTKPTPTFTQGALPSGNG